MAATDLTVGPDTLPLRQSSPAGAFMNEHGLDIYAKAKECRHMLLELVGSRLQPMINL